MAISGTSSGLPHLNFTSNVQDPAKKLLQQMDADSDGKVSRQELTVAAERMSASRAQGTEIRDAAAARRAPVPPSADELLAKADKDGDGSLSVEDLSAMIAEHETHAAARGGARSDGSPPDGPPPGKPPVDGAAAPAHRGAGSSSSSAAEEPDPADTNGDGNISAAEKLIYELSHPKQGAVAEA